MLIFLLKVGITNIRQGISIALVLSNESLTKEDQKMYKRHKNYVTIDMEK